MKLLELFAGTRSISKAFERRGHETLSVENDRRHENIDMYEDVLTLTSEKILSVFGRPDIIWASPPCTSYSIAGISPDELESYLDGIIGEVEHGTV